MPMPTAAGDELRLDKPAGTITLRIEGQPVRTLRRPTVKQLRHLIERWTALRDEVFDMSREVPADPAQPNGRKIHPPREGVPAFAVQEIGARWLSEVIEVLTGEAIDSDDLPAWTTTGGTMFSALTAHWFEVPLAFGGSPNGSPPDEQPIDPTAPTPTTPTIPVAPTILRQAIPGLPLPG
jgi:hypothetical protein